MEAFLVSTGIVALAEIGDKTQLLAFILAAKFRKPVPIILGILAATLANHGFAGALGSWITSLLGPETLRGVLGISFIGMAIWTLIPDEFDEKDAKIARFGVFGTTLVAFFLAEMGDKTQIATVALAAQYHAFFSVVAGTTLGMMIANVPAVLLGDRIAHRMPVKLVHRIAAAIFALLGIATLLAPTLLSLAFAATTPSGQPSPGFPAHWWAPVLREGAPGWEILPQEAGPGEVILSKRHELGLLSNFAPTPFTFRGQRYASLEGFWQMMLYPENGSDPRATFPSLRWKHSRAEVARMTSFEAKEAGTLAEENMVRMGIRWVTFEGKRIEYRPVGPGDHYRLIVAATWEKVKQNPRVKEILLSTGNLVLRPDHHPEPNAPAAWRYFEILTEIRSELRRPPASR